MVKQTASESPDDQRSETPRAPAARADAADVRQGADGDGRTPASADRTDAHGSRKKAGKGATAGTRGKPEKRHKHDAHGARGAHDAHRASDTFGTRDVPGTSDGSDRQDEPNRADKVDKAAKPKKSHKSHKSAAPDNSGESHMSRMPVSSGKSGVSAAPGKSGTSASSGKSNEPDTPAGPGTPGTSDTSAAPGKSGRSNEPDTPAGPGTSATSDTSAAPGKSGRSNNPNTSAAPGKSASSASSGKASKSGKPGKPGKPGKASKSGKSSKPSKSDKPDKSGTSRKSGLSTALGKPKKKGGKKGGKKKNGKKAGVRAPAARAGSGGGTPPEEHGAADPPSTSPVTRAGRTARVPASPVRTGRARHPHAVVYVRLPAGRASSRSAADVDRARRLAAARGWSVADAHVVVDDGAPHAASPGWARVRALVDTGAADVVVGVDLDRFARTIADVVELVDAGARVVLADGTMDLTAADGAAQARLLSAVDAFQTRRRGERHRRAIRDRAAAGRPEVSGRRAFGFAQDGVTVVDAEADVVRRIYREFVGGATVYGIAAALAAENAPLGTGRSWNRTRVRATLRSPIYRGAVIHHGRAVASDTVPAVVDDATWNAAQAILDDPSRRVSPGPSRQHLLSGVLACGVDGCPGMTAYAQGRYRCTVSARHATVRADIAEDIARRAVARAVVTSGADVTTRVDIDPHAVEAIGRLYDGAAVVPASDADDILRAVEAAFDREPVDRQRDVVQALLRLRIARRPHANTVSVVAAARA